MAQDLGFVLAGELDAARKEAATLRATNCEQLARLHTAQQEISRRDTLLAEAESALAEALQDRRSAEDGCALIEEENRALMRAVSTKDEQIMALEEANAALTLERDALRDALAIEMQGGGRSREARGRGGGGSVQDPSWTEELGDSL